MSVRTLAALAFLAFVLDARARVEAQDLPTETFEQLVGLAEQGHTGSQFVLGLADATTVRGVPADEAEAVRWYRIAAEQGYADAQVQLRGHVRQR